MRFLYCFAGAAGVACSLATGCSSSSNPGFGNDASVSPPKDSGIEEEAAACVPIPGLVDADLSFVKTSDAAGSSCGVCLVDQCADAIRTCETDCVCGNYFVCVAYEADAGLTAFSTCAGGAGSTLLNNTGVVALGTCEYNMCKAECYPPVDGGLDAGTGGGG
jgi:hypothetical protein